MQATGGVKGPAPKRAAKSSSKRKGKTDKQLAIFGKTKAVREAAKKRLGAGFANT